MENLNDNRQWRIFERFFVNIGSFATAESGDKVYLDANAFRILGIAPTESMTLDADYFSDIIASIKREPVKDESDVYVLRREGQTLFVRILSDEKENSGVTGFVQDVTTEAVRREAAGNPDFDPITNLLTGSAFLKKTEALLLENREKPAVIAVLNLLDLSKPEGHVHSDNVMASAAAALMLFVSENVVVAMRNFKGFLVFITGTEKAEALKILENMRKTVSKCKITDIYGNASIEDAAVELCLNIGYCLYPEQADSISDLMLYSDFAAHETRNERGVVREFSPNEYNKEKLGYSELQVFNKIVDENLVVYHFQPIVAASNGEIVAYEALMRPVSSEPMSPLELISMADRLNKLYEIEKLTFTNTLDYLNKNADDFKGKKLFINSITSNCLTDEDFREIKDTYGELMERVVVEVTEQNDLTGEIISTLTERYGNSGIAIDDYGTGYSNTSNLLRCLPNYIKIDRSLIQNIDKDAKKQHFVKSIINYCKENGIKVLGEGVETKDELQWIIMAGADFIQGYYTSRPKPTIVKEIPKETKDFITKTYIERSVTTERSVYLLIDEESVQIDLLPPSEYTDLLVSTAKTRLLSNPETELNMSIVIADNTDCELELKNVSIRGFYRPSLDISNNCAVTLIISGICRFSYSGISLPPSSSLTIKGDGELYIVSDANNSMGIGGNYVSDYGNIIVDMEGGLDIAVNGDNSVGIGGGTNSVSNEIDIAGGRVKLLTTGETCLGIGCYGGDTCVRVGKNARLDIKTTGDKAVGLGSFEGEIDIGISGIVNCYAAGREATAIGVLEGGSGRVELNNGTADVILKAVKGVGIGTVGGEVEIYAAKSFLKLICSGAEVTSVGDYSGSGRIEISDSTIDIGHFSESNTVQIGTGKGETIVRDCDIIRGDIYNNKA